MREKNIGQKLHPVLWRGKQWAVTTYGIERTNGTYAIPKDRLTETHGDWNWISHMRGKVWTDMQDFEQAFNHALLLHIPADPAYD